MCVCVYVCLSEHIKWCPVCVCVCVCVYCIVMYVCVCLYLSVLYVCMCLLYVCIVCVYVCTVCMCVYVCMCTVLQCIVLYYAWIPSFLSHGLTRKVTCSAFLQSQACTSQDQYTKSPLFLSYNLVGPLPRPLPHTTVVTTSS